jgi:hypothetical protein
MTLSRVQSSLLASLSQFVPKRHTSDIAVDTLGLPIECQFTPANVQDRDALAPVLGDGHRKSPIVTMCFALAFLLIRRLARLSPHPP